MLRIALVNMPFAAWNRPSFALSQLSALVARDFAGRAAAEVHYVNLQYAERIGPRDYEAVSEQLEHLHSGVGDWLFRHLAFPDAPDNTEEYFRRFYRGDRWDGFRELILAERAGLREFCAQLIAEHRLAEADIVGFTSMFAQNGPSIAVARMIKELNPGVITLLGGANCEVPMGGVIAERVPVIDYVFSGPALETLPAFLRLVLEDRLAEADAIPGILSQRNCRVPRYASAIGADHDIDDFFAPDYSAFLRGLEDHRTLTARSEAEPTLFFETSRGCWWGERSHCTFCGLNGQSMHYRSMSAPLAVRQFEWLFQHAPACTTFFGTDNVMPRSYARDVFPQLTPPPGSYIYYEVKLPLSRQDLAAMARAGVTTVQPGIEALASSTLQLMGKGTTVFHNLQFLLSCRRFGIEPDWNLLIGFPGESTDVYEKYARDIPLLTHLTPPHGCYLVRFDRYSPYFKRREEYGLDLHPMDYYELIYPFEPEALERIAYFFADHSLSPYQIASAEHHDALRALVAAWREAWGGGTKTPERDLRLVEAADGWEILDSRDGVEQRYPADEPTRRVLRRLASPVRLDRLAREWPMEAERIEERIGWLLEHGMLFVEDGRALSLVLADLDEAEGGPDEADEQADPAPRPALLGGTPLPLLPVPRPPVTAGPTRR
jgi:magnesium-protoporphyrin IX monomethyl ester (oxidative) cyclase